MYLVEYVKILKNQNKKYCCCSYSVDEAIDFSKKLANSSNIKSVEVSAIDFTKTEILFKNEKYF